MSYVLDTFTPKEVDVKFPTYLFGHPGPSLNNFLTSVVSHVDDPFTTRLYTSVSRRLRGGVVTDHFGVSTPMSVLGCHHLGDRHKSVSDFFGVCKLRSDNLVGTPDVGRFGTLRWGTW